MIKQDPMDPLNLHFLRGFTESYNLPLSLNPVRSNRIYPVFVSFTSYRYNYLVRFNESIVYCCITLYSDALPDCKVVHLSLDRVRSNRIYPVFVSFTSYRYNYLGRFNESIVYYCTTLYSVALADCKVVHLSLDRVKSNRM